MPRRKRNTPNLTPTATDAGPLVVFSIRTAADGSTIWTRAGSAKQLEDGSINITLDLLPMSGRLHVRRMSPGDYTLPAPL